MFFHLFIVTVRNLPLLRVETYSPCRRTFSHWRMVLTLTPISRPMVATFLVVVPVFRSQDRRKYKNSQTEFFIFRQCFPSLSITSPCQTGAHQFLLIRMGDFIRPQATQRYLAQTIVVCFTETSLYLFSHILRIYFCSQLLGSNLLSQTTV